ncbi:hypothetical protein RP20_CCG019718 [Aedes albopictus]|nr:hypothetical protein RP20_CCG019718 [Aedes albopictus]
MKRVKTVRHAKTDSGCDNRSIVSLWVQHDGAMKNVEKRKGFRSALGIRTPARSLVDEEKGLASFCFFPIFFADTTELGFFFTQEHPSHQTPGPNKTATRGRCERTANNRTDQQLAGNWRNAADEPKLLQSSPATLPTARSNGAPRAANRVEPERARNQRETFTAPVTSLLHVLFSYAAMLRNAMLCLDRDPKEGADEHVRECGAPVMMDYGESARCVRGS